MRQNIESTNTTEVDAKFMEVAEAINNQMAKAPGWEWLNEIPDEIEE